MNKYNKLTNFSLFFFYCFISFIIGLLLADKLKINDFLNYINQKIYSSYSLEKITSLDKDITAHTYQKNKVHDGLILLSSPYINNPAVILTNSEGKILHKWNIEKKIFNKKTLDIHKGYKKSDSEAVYGINDVELLPDGSIIFCQSIMEFSSYRSQRIAKADKNSNIIWQKPGFCHHDLFLNKDKIYVVSSDIQDTIKYIDKTKFPNTKFISGYVNIFSKDGELLQRINIEDAFLNSEYKHFLSLFQLDLPLQKFTLKDGSYVIDPIHLNSVQYITQEQASKTDFLNAGDLLISTRGNSSISVLRPEENKIIMASRGPWYHQHYVRMDDDALIYIYDNEGQAMITNENKNNEPIVTHQPRIVTLDLKEYKSKIALENNSGYNISSYWRGYYKKLANNTFIFSSSDKGTVLQMDQKGKIIWELKTTKDRKEDKIPYTKKLMSVKYYDKEYINFLDNNN